MNTLYLTVGISGSGKSLFTLKTKELLNAVEVNADNIRKELGDISDQSKNKEVFEKVDILIDENLKKSNVILSNTNLQYSIVKKYSEKYPDSQLVVFLMKDSTSPNLCFERINKDIENNVERSNVPKEVVYKQWEKWATFYKTILSEECISNVSYFMVNNEFVAKPIKGKIKSVFEH